VEETGALSQYGVKPRLNQWGPTELTPGYFINKNRPKHGWLLPGGGGVCNVTVMPHTTRKWFQGTSMYPATPHFYFVDLNPAVAGCCLGLYPCNPSLRPSPTHQMHGGPPLWSESPVGSRWYRCSLYCWGLSLKHWTPRNVQMGVSKPYITEWIGATPAVKLKALGFRTGCLPLVEPNTVSEISRCFRSGWFEKRTFFSSL